MDGNNTDDNSAAGASAIVDASSSQPGISTSSITTVGDTQPPQYPPSPHSQPTTVTTTDDSFAKPSDSSTSQTLLQSSVPTSTWTSMEAEQQVGPSSQSNSFPNVPFMIAPENHIAPTPSSSSSQHGSNPDAGKGGRGGSGRGGKSRRGSTITRLNVGVAADGSLPDRQRRKSMRAKESLQSEFAFGEYERGDVPDGRGDGGGGGGAAGEAKKLRRASRLGGPHAGKGKGWRKGQGKGPAPKISLRLAEGGSSAAAIEARYMQGYNRELDSSDDEGLAFEEQFILRMPEGPDCERLREMVKKKKVGEDVWFKFKDSRRAVFHIGDTTYSAKLVDLPSIIESQKTLDNKHMFKVADICQMLLVEDPLASEDVVTEGSGKPMNVEDFVFPHGITPPMKHARKRRFRKRVARRTIETVEKEVERLLEEDAKAEKVQFEILDGVNADLSDSEFGTPLPGETPRPEARSGTEAMSELGEGETPRRLTEDEGGAEGEEGDLGSDAGGSVFGGSDEGEGEGEGEFDADLAAELDKEMQGLEEDEEEEGEGEEDEDDEDEDDEDEDEGEEDEEMDEESLELARRHKLLLAEVRDLDTAVKKKEAEVTGTTNPLIKQRHEDSLRKLVAERDIKRNQLEQNGAA